MNKKIEVDKQTEADEPIENQKQADNDTRQEVFQISANRGRARHKMRYVERSVDDTGDCRLCVGAISPEEDDTESS